MQTTKKRLKQFWISHEACTWLERKSKETGKSQAEIVRELIDKAKS